MYSVIQFIWNSSLPSTALQVLVCVVNVFFFFLNHKGMISTTFRIVPTSREGRREVRLGKSRRKGEKKKNRQNGKIGQDRRMGAYRFMLSSVLP